MLSCFNFCRITKLAVSTKAETEAVTPINVHLLSLQSSRNAKYKALKLTFKTKDYDI